MKVFCFVLFVFVRCWLFLASLPTFVLKAEVTSGLLAQFVAGKLRKAASSNCRHVVSTPSVSDCLNMNSNQQHFGHMSDMRRETTKHLLSFSAAIQRSSKLKDQTIYYCLSCW